jgi:hypothetical protein
VWVILREPLNAVEGTLNFVERFEGLRVGVRVRYFNPDTKEKDMDTQSSHTTKLKF